MGQFSYRHIRCILKHFDTDVRLAVSWWALLEGKGRSGGPRTVQPVVGPPLFTVRRQFWCEREGKLTADPLPPAGPSTHQLRDRMHGSM